jgi:RNA polymerase sigma-70 factor (ECF subfamily)
MFKRQRPPPAAPTPAAVEATHSTPGPTPPQPSNLAAERDDESLMLLARGGDLDAFNLLVLRHQRAVFNVCLRTLNDAVLAEDAAQEAIVRAWQRADTFRGGAVLPWLLRIARNRAIDLIRERSRRPAASMDAEPYEMEPVWTTQVQREGPEARALRGEVATILERALAALPEDQRAVVLLSDVHGLPYEEVAAATGAALGTVKSRLSRARAKLRQTLTDDPAAAELFDRFVRMQGDGAAAGNGRQSVSQPPEANDA